MKKKFLTGILASQVILQLVLTTQANAATIASLLSRSFLENIGANFVYDALKNTLLGGLPGVNETTNLTESLFDNLGIETLVSSGAATFYIDDVTKQVNALEIDLKPPQVNSSLVDSEITSIKVSPLITTQKGAQYSAASLARATTETTLFYDIAISGVETIVTKLTFGQLTQETAYSVAYALAYINGEFDFKPLDVESIALERSCCPQSSSLNYKLSTSNIFASIGSKILSTIEQPAFAADTCSPCRSIPEPDASIGLLLLGTLGIGTVVLKEQLFKRRAS